MPSPAADEHGELARQRNGIGLRAIGSSRFAFRRSAQLHTNRSAPRMRWHQHLLDLGIESIAVGAFDCPGFAHALTVALCDLLG